MHRYLSILLLFGFATVLSGCLGDAGTMGTQTDPDVHVVTDPKDFSYLQNGSMPGGHVHDYWNGQEVVRVLADEVACECSSTYWNGAEGAVLGRFRPPTDHLVPQGAGSLNVTASWRIANGSYGDMALYVKTANTTEASFVAFLRNGEQVTFASTNDDNDPPHHRLSLWEFVVRAHPPTGKQDAKVEDYMVSLVVDAEKGLPIPAFPPHPDLWGGARELMLLEETQEVEAELKLFTTHTCSGCLAHHPLQVGRIVPYDAAYVEVVVRVVQGLPPSMALWFHGADTWEHAPAEPDEDGLRERIWRLDVADRPDSPYAKRSLWDFHLALDDGDPVRAWSGTYEITIKVVRAAE